MTYEQARDELLELRRIMCQREGASTDRMLDVIRAAAHLLGQAPDEKGMLTLIQATIWEAERRGAWLLLNPLRHNTPAPERGGRTSGPSAGGAS